MPSFPISGWPETVQLVIRAMCPLGSWEPLDMLHQSISQQVFSLVQLFFLFQKEEYD